MGDILVIVVTWNAMTWIERCLGSVRDSSVKADILVVDNGSSDGTREYIQSMFPNAILIVNDNNVGFGAANNIGFNYAIKHGYKFTYLLNQDAWLCKDCLKTMIASIRTGYGILSPMQTDAKGRLDRNFKKQCGKYLSVEKDSEVVTVPFVMAAHWLVPTATIKIVGGFSPAFTQYGEDDNYIDRLHFHRLKCGVVTAATAIHDRSERPSDKEKRMRLKCISTIVRLSNPNSSFTLQRIITPLRLLGISIKNCSTSPLAFLPKLWEKMPVIRKARKESKSQGAFLRT